MIHVKNGTMTKEFELSGGPLYVGPGSEDAVAAVIGHELAELNAFAEELGGETRTAHEIAQEIETAIQRELLMESRAYCQISFSDIHILTLLIPGLL